MNSPARTDTFCEWTRHEVARQLGVSIATVRRMEGRELHPSTDERGVRLFQRTEVLLVRERRAQRPISPRDDAGEVAARVFELFKAGADLRKVVITARVHPHVVRDLYAEWLLTLNEGENRRRIEKLDVEDRRERARMVREQREFERTLEGTSRHGRAR